MGMLWQLLMLAWIFFFFFIVHIKSLHFLPNYLLQASSLPAAMDLSGETCSSSTFEVPEGNFS